MRLMAIEAMYPGMRWIRLFPGNAGYHHAKLVREWLVRPERRIKLHFVPAYCPYSNPIEGLWALMHRRTTHHKCCATFREFGGAMPTFLREDVPRNWRTLCDQVTDSFHVIIDPALVHLNTLRPGRGGRGIHRR